MINLGTIILYSNTTDFLKSKGKLNWIRKEEPLYPFFELAKHFLNKGRYGGKAPLTSGTDLLRMAKLF